MQGILTGVFVSLFLMVYRTSNPHIAVLANIKNTHYYRNVNRFTTDVVIRDDLLIVRFDAQLYFGNANYFKSHLYELVAEKGDRLRGVILNAETINYLDATAANTLKKVIEKLYEKGIHFFIAGAIGPTRDLLYSSGIMELLPKECLFAETREAVAFFDDPTKKSQTQYMVAHQSNIKGN